MEGWKKGKKLGKLDERFVYLNAWFIYPNVGDQAHMFAFLSFKLNQTAGNHLRSYTEYANKYEEF